MSALTAPLPAPLDLMPDFSAVTAKQLRSELDRTGLATITDFFSAELHQRFVDDILASVDKAKPSSGYKYSLKYEEVADHALCQLVRSQPFADFVNEILAGILPYALGPEDIQMGYSIIKGKGDKVPYHFDGLNVMNFIFPIILPEQDAGHVDLWTLPNVIGFKRSFYTRLISKLLQKLPLTEKLFRKQGVTYRERSLLAFYGCRTYHGVEPATRDGLRVIASINVRFRRP